VKRFDNGEWVCVELGMEDDDMVRFFQICFCSFIFFDSDLFCRGLWVVFDKQLLSVSFASCITFSDGWTEQDSNQHSVLFARPLQLRDEAKRSRSSFSIAPNDSGAAR
jgi:hypothetical protein